jgi:hypothetical protein
MLWLLSPAVASAAVHSVDPADPAAFADGASALSVASSGDTLVLAPGTHGTCIFSNGTTIELVGAGSGSTILEPTDACHSMVTGNAWAEVYCPVPRKSTRSIPAKMTPPGGWNTNSAGVPPGSDPWQWDIGEASVPTSSRTT